MLLILLACTMNKDAVSTTIDQSGDDTSSTIDPCTVDLDGDPSSVTSAWVRITNPGSEVTHVTTAETVPMTAEGGGIGGVAAWEWMTEGGAGLGCYTSSCSFTPEAAGEYVLKVVVEDGCGDSDSDAVVIIADH